MALLAKDNDELELLPREKSQHMSRLPDWTTDRLYLLSSSLLRSLAQQQPNGTYLSSVGDAAVK